MYFAIIVKWFKIKKNYKTDEGSLWKEKRKTGNIPKYEQIATDIAYQIVEGTYKEGEKIYARSSIGSRYNVSSETARRAVCVLADWDIVEVEKTAA
jgi:transcriptional regulator, GntR family